MSLNITQATGFDNVILAICTVLLIVVVHDLRGLMQVLALMIRAGVLSAGGACVKIN
jgi:hypothetical protein